MTGHCHASLGLQTSLLGAKLRKMDFQGLEMSCSVRCKYQADGREKSLNKVQATVICQFEWVKD